MESPQVARHGSLPLGRALANATDEQGKCADEALARRVETVLAAGRWQKHCTIGITVRNAVVTLDGTCSDDVCLDTVQQAVMAVACVRAVESRLSWVLPDCGIGYARDI
jgi:osmotically-inducible protein OsmY